MVIISVIVPVYRIEQYLSSCIDSILAQTFQELEVILVDDGSPDRCGQICDYYESLDERIRVIHQKNAGLSCARNAGVKLAQGKYFCFVDGDDLLHPKFCEELFKLINDTEYDFSTCRVCRFRDGETPEPVLSDKEPVVMSTVDYLQEQLEKKREFGVWNRLYKKELFEEFQFYPGKIHEDVIFSADLASFYGTVISTDKQLYCYRQRRNSIVAKGSQKCSPDRVFAGEYLVKASRESFPKLYRKCLKYAVDYPWMFVDKYYVDRGKNEDRVFLLQLQQFITKYLSDLKKMEEIDPLIRKRMALFAKSRVLYGLNAYSRLLRVYLYHFLRKDAYSDGHGI